MLKFVFLAVLVAVANAQTKNLVELAKELGATTLVDFLEKAELNDTIATGGPFTVFGPTNAAFAALPKSLVDELNKNKTLLQDVLKYHVISGKVMSSALTNDMTVDTLKTNSKIRVNIYDKTPKVITITGSPVNTADKEASNGVIHVLDKVMLPPTGTVVDEVKANPDFSTLLNAVVKADLADTLAGEGPFTVFAPTNAAFAKIPKADLDALLKDKTQLANVLKYHVASGTTYSSGLSNNQMIPTLEGKSLKVEISASGVKIGSAMVSTADVAVTNGVIHVIDTVQLPETTSGATTFSASLGLVLSALVALLLKW